MNADPPIGLSDGQSKLAPIGGFFELEIPVAGHAYHEDAMALSTGRACLMACLCHMKPTRAFVPHYTCNATLHPFRQLNIELVFYELDECFRPFKIPDLLDDDCFLLTNYWGLQRGLANEFVDRIRDKLVIDNTHDFYWRNEVPLSWSFTSARKWFGVPDGAFLYSPQSIGHDRILNEKIPRNTDISLDYALNRWRGNQQQGFRQYQVYEESLGLKLQRISKYSEAVLSRLDLQAAAQQRKQNYEYLEGQLSSTNQIELLNGFGQTPFAYPYLPLHPVDRDKLYQLQVFVPQLWRDVLRRGAVCDHSKIWSTQLLPLPIDHRYGLEEMRRIVDVVRQLENIDEP